MREKFLRILSVPQNIVVDLNIVMNTWYSRRSFYFILFYFIITWEGLETLQLRTLTLDLFNSAAPSNYLVGAHVKLFLRDKAARLTDWKSF